MKRKSIIAIFAAIMVMASAVLCCAETGLKIESSYPRDGQKNTSMENLGVKIEFNNKVNDEKAVKANANAVVLKDQNGKKVPIDVLYSNKNGKMMLVVANTTGKYKVENNADYTLTISGDFQDNEGNVLGKDESITFRTYNQKVNNLVNTGMMVVMFGGLFLVSMRANKNKKEDEDDDQEADSFNPYREAKRTGKSVAEVKAEHEKELEKKAKKKKKKNEPVYEKKIDNCAELLNNVYHVHAPAPISKEDRSVEALERMRKAKKAAAKAELAAKRKPKKKK